MVIVRNAAVEDAGALGRIHVRGWQVAYRGLLPGAYLDDLRPEVRADRWRDRIGALDDRVAVLVAEQEGAVAGFVSVGPARRQDGPGELYAIYVDPDRWGAGVGRALIGRAEQTLAGSGFTEAVLWVFAANARARRFYERSGWRPDGAEHLFEAGGVKVPEVRYRHTLDAAGLDAG